MHKEVGSTWVLNHHGKLWPVVLCDEDTPHKPFIESRPKCGYTFPAILLGKHKYVWVIDSDLFEYELCRDYTTTTPSGSDEKDEEVRRQAFTEALEFHDHLFWRNYILSDAAARKLERRMGRRVNHGDDDDDEIEFLGVRELGAGNKPFGYVPPMSTGSRSAKKRRYPLTPDPTPSKRAKYPSFEIVDDKDEDSEFVYSKRSPTDPFTSQQSDESPKEELKVEEQKKTDMPVGDDQVVLYVGENRTPFVVPKAAVSRYNLLSDQVRHKDVTGYYIGCDELEQANPKDFIDVAEFLQHGDFKPSLIETTTVPIPHIEGITTGEKSKVAENCGYAFLIARRLAMKDLQKLVVEKIRALYPLEPFSLLLLSKIVFSMAPNADTDDDTVVEVRGLLIDHVFEYYYTLMEAHASTLRSVLMDYQDLASAVHERLARAPEGGGQDMEG